MQVTVSGTVRVHSLLASEIAPRLGEYGLGIHNQPLGDQQPIGKAAPISEIHRLECAGIRAPLRTLPIGHDVGPMESSMSTGSPTWDGPPIPKVGHVLARRAQEMRNLSGGHDQVFHIPECSVQTL